MDLHDPVAHQVEVVVEVPTLITYIGVWEKQVVVICLHHLTDEKVEAFSSIILSGFPLRLEKLKKWEGIFQSGNFEQTGEVQENHTKYWKNQGISDKCYLLFLVLFK